MNRRQAIVGTLIGAALASAPAFAASGAVLPARMTFIDMFGNADWVVKLVIIGLAVASVTTWTVFLAKTAELKRNDQAYRKVRDTLYAARGIEAVRGHADAATPMLDAALIELRLSNDALHDTDGIKERIATRFSRMEAEAASGMTRKINILATIGATAPFVGLFGTVWGIMNSFVGIAEHQTTNLAVVAPGIAEALLATAVGLIAAIPAVVIYNHFSRTVAAQRALVSDVAAAIINLVSRDLSRGVAIRAATPVQAVE